MKGKIKIVEIDWLIDSNRNRPIRATAQYDFMQRKIKKPIKKKTKTKGKNKSDTAEPTKDEPEESKSKLSMRLQTPPKLSLEASGMFSMIFVSVFTESCTVQLFQAALIRKEAALEEDGFTLFTDPANFTYSFALVRQDTAEVLQRCNVRQSSGDSLSIPLPLHSLRLPDHFHPSPLTLHLPSPHAVLFTLPLAFPDYPSPLLKYKIPDPNPPLFAMQMYRSTENSKEFCIIAVVADVLGHPCVHELAPQGSQFNFTMKRWRSVFELRTGQTWQATANDVFPTKGRWRWNGKEVVWHLLNENGNEIPGAEATRKPAPAIEPTPLLPFVMKSKAAPTKSGGKSRKVSSVMRVTSGKVSKTCDGRMDVSRSAHSGASKLKPSTKRQERKGKPQGGLKRAKIDAPA